MKTLLVTGSGGLIGSEVVSFFAGRGWKVHGVDNNMRQDFFGIGGDTTWNVERLKSVFAHYEHSHLDIRDRSQVRNLIDQIKPTAVVHAAAQPSHDLAASRPLMISMLMLWEHSTYLRPCIIFLLMCLLFICLQTRYMVTHLII